MQWRRIILVIWLFVAVFFGFRWGVFAEEMCGDKDIDCIQRQISELTNALNMSKSATKPLESEISKLSAKIKTIQSQIDIAAKKQVLVEKGLIARSEKVGVSYAILAAKTREMYIKLRSEPLWISLLTREGLGLGRRELLYRQESNDSDKQIIVNLVSEIGTLEIDKKNLEADKIKMKKLQAELDKQNVFFQGEVKKAKAFQSDLSGKISALSAKQAAILAEKQGTFSTTVGEVPLADDPNSRPDFNPGFSPAFAVFSFGAPHFKGMSQYGAYGRAKSGQGVEEILKAYYGGGIEIKKDYDTGKQIGVSGYGRMDIETYVKRVYEVPNSWGDNGGMEALKAQAVAARSYALSWTDEGRGGSICTTEACQVYKNSGKGGKWEEAVNATRGWVLWANGKPLKAWFASTSGGYQESYTDSYSGYTTPGFWDANGGRGGWTGQAYEKIAGSPWFYKGWYKKRTGETCNRSHPWVTGEEMADILNAWKVLKNGSDDRVLPLGGCGGGNPYSLSELRSKSEGVGGGYQNVSGVSVSYSDGGYTNTVHFETNKGGVDMSGSEFKSVFNVRAPGWVSLKSGLFNIEKK